MAKLDVLAKLAGAILIPIVLFVLGTNHTDRIAQAEARRLSADRSMEHTRRDLDRVAIILRHLASDNVGERRLAMHFVEYLNANGQFPSDLYPVLISALGDQDQVVRRSATELLGQLRTLHPTIDADPRLLFPAPAEADGEASAPVMLHPTARAFYERRITEP